MNLRGLAFLAALALSSLPVACLLSEPSPLIKPPARGPSILHGREFPPTSRILTDDPGTFYVAVELADPSTVFRWEALLDWPTRSIDLARGEGGGANNDLNIVVIPFSTRDLLTRDGECHEITFRAGLSLDPRDPQSVETDTTSWRFVPSGHVGGCVPFDGGLGDGSFDAPLEGGDP